MSETHTPETVARTIAELFKLGEVHRRGDKRGLPLQREGRGIVKNEGRCPEAGFQGTFWVRCAGDAMKNGDRD